MNQRNKGITLIALVITIIVLLILAGVSLSLVMGEEGLIGRTISARDVNENAEEKELVELAVSTAQIDGHGNLNETNLNNALKETFKNSNEVTPNSEGWDYEANKKYKIYSNGKVEEMKEDQIILPYGYIECEYLESTGTQYIDTGYYSNSETRTILEFSYIMTNNDQYSNGAIFGSANNGNGRPGYSICVTLDNKIYYRNSEIAESFNTNDDIVPNEIYTVDVFKNDIKINNNCYTSDMGLLGNKQNYSSFLFARQQPEWTNNVYSILIGRIYMCKIYENEVLQRDFIPCLDDNGIACMYDTVTNTTFYNKGSGTFSYKIKE